MGEVIETRALLRAMRAAEDHYRQAIRWDRTMWIERHLVATRIALYDRLIRYCPDDAHCADDAIADHDLRILVDGIAWLAVFGSSTPSDRELIAVLAEIISCDVAVLQPA